MSHAQRLKMISKSILMADTMNLKIYERHDIDLRVNLIILKINEIIYQPNLSILRVKLDL